MNIMRGNRGKTSLRTDQNDSSTRKNTSRHALGGVVAFLLLLLTTLVPVSMSSAEVSPNRFELDNHTISVLPTSGQAEFVGKVSMRLHLSNTAGDAVKMLITGDLLLTQPGCAKLRVNYLDGDGNLVPGKVEHSEPLSWPNGVEEVEEWSVHPDYRNVRLEVLYGPTCSTLSEIGQKTSNLQADMSSLGVGERWVSGVAYDYGSIIDNGGIADSIAIRWDAATNPAPTLDRGDARITAMVSHLPPGCSKLQAKHYDADGGYLGTTWTKEICGPVPTKVVASNFASNANLHRISIRLRTRPWVGGPISYSPAEHFYLN